jgi:quinol monooxygenase YgiN
MKRRQFVQGLGVMVTAGTARQESRMYGLIGKMTATTGSRDALITLLLEGTQAMPGCLSYVVSQDTTEADAIWITEVWDSEASHKASLSLPAVQAVIGKARPLIAGFSHRVVTTPVGGSGFINAECRMPN